MKKLYCKVLLLLFAVPAAAAAEGEVQVHGKVEAGLQGVDIESNNSAKFQEYRDVDDGFIGMFELDVLKSDYFLKLDAVHPGLDDQAIDLKGGRYGDFKYKLYYDEMPHNYSFNSLSFYRGLGTNQLVVPADPLATPPNSFETSTATWTPFDYSVQHKKYGGDFKLSLHSPFYVTVGAERREQDGTRPFSVRENIEAPLPVSYATNNLSVKTGYLGKTISTSLTGMLSSFENDNKFLLWDDPSPTSAATILQNSVLDPDNDFGKLTADFSWRELPLKSTLAMAASYANLSNSVSAEEVNLNSRTLTGADLTDFNRLNRRTFDGDIDYMTFSIAAVSMPLAKLDTKIYYNYLDKDNDSSRIFYNATQGDNAKELLSYQKDTAGIDVGYRLPQRTKVDGGYEYENVDRSTRSPAFTSGTETVYRYDNPESTTNDIFFLKFKNSTLSWLTANLKYKHLERDSDFTGIYNPYRERGVIRFDAANKDMDEVKLGFELYTFSWLDIGVDFTYQNNDYDNNRETRTDDERKNVYLDLAWHTVLKATVSAFVGFENTETDANRITNLQEETVYAQTVDDDFWTYGLALNIPNVVYKLSLNFAWQYQKSDGEINFDNSITNTSLVDIKDSDDYAKKTFEAKAVYAIDPKLSMTVGYLYEDYEYSDVAYANYQYILNNSDYYSGTFFDQNYTANVGYVLLAYKF
jgi:MtrB/PioB family decaheme-associated outer membrane protein